MQAPLDFFGPLLLKILSELGQSKIADLETNKSYY